MHRSVLLTVSAAFLVAGCGGATGSGTLAFSDTAVSFARSTPVPAREVASVSECAETAECQRACEAGQIHSCTRWGDMLHGDEPARAEALWLDACQRREGMACLRMMALAASEPRTADAYARHACAYGVVSACGLLGSILTLRGFGGKDEQRASLLGDAAEVFEMGCGFGHWQSCVSAGIAYAHEELASQPSRPAGFVTRAFELAAGACEARDIDACLFRGLVLEKHDKLKGAGENYARGCRTFIEAASPMPYEEAVREPPCRRARELAVVPAPESIERTELADRRADPAPSGLTYLVREHAAIRVAGKRAIVPSAPVRVTMQRLERHRIDARVLMCLSSSGLVEMLRVVESSEFANYDLKLLENMRTWRYRPYVRDGKAVRVCTAVTFVYMQRN